MSVPSTLSVDILETILRSAQNLLSKKQQELDRVTIFLASERIPEEVGVTGLVQEILQPLLNNLENANRAARRVSGHFFDALANFGFFSACFTPIRFQDYFYSCVEQAAQAKALQSSAKRHIEERKAWIMSVEGRSYITDQLEKRASERRRVLEKIEAESIKSAMLKDEVRSINQLISLIEKLFPLRENIGRVDLIPGLSMFAERLSLELLSPRDAASIIRLILNASSAAVELRSGDELAEVEMAQAELVVNGEQEMALFGRNLHPLRLVRTEEGAELIVVDGPVLKLALKEPERRVLARMRQIKTVVLSAGAVRPVSTIPVEA